MTYYNNLLLKFMKFFTNYLLRGNRRALGIYFSCHRYYVKEHKLFNLYVSSEYCKSFPKNSGVLQRFCLKDAFQTTET